jgi:hypothetical protein
VSRCALLAALTGLLLAAPESRAQGDLRRVQSAIHPGPRLVWPSPPSRGDNGSWFGISRDAELGSGAGTAVLGLGIGAALVATAPVWGPHELFDRGFDQRGWFPPHPHVLDDRPYMVIGNCPDSPTVGDNYFDPLHVKPWSLRMSVDAGNDFDDLSRFGGQVFLDTSIYRLGLLANWNYFRENVPGGTDEALMADYNLTWRITQSERVLMHVGAGLRTWTFDGDTDPGFNALYRTDVFPFNGMHVSAVFEYGNLRSARVWHGQIQAGYTFSHGEVFVGYDFFRIRTVNLQGPMAGARLWF